MLSCNVLVLRRCGVDDRQILEFLKMTFTHLDISFTHLITGDDSKNMVSRLMITSCVG